MSRLAAATVVAATAMLLTVPMAQADTPDCVSRGEYARIAPGMTMTKVHRIVDFEGLVTGLGAPNELRYYDTCTGRGMVQVLFNPRGRVVSKDGRFF